MSNKQNTKTTNKFDDVFNRNPERSRYLFKKAYESLHNFKTDFQDALKEKDLEKLRAVKHNSTVLLTTFEFQEIINMLESSKNILMNSPDDEMIKKQLEEGSILFDSALKKISGDLDE